MKNITLKDVQDFAYLANEAYKVEKPTSDKDYKKDKHLPKDGIITNSTTNSSFEVIDQINEKSKILGIDTGGFSATVFKDTNTNEYVIAFRDSNDMQDIRDDLIMGATSTGLLGDITNKQFKEAFAFASEQIARIQAQNPDAKISITGHSLGASLAQYMLIRQDIMAIK